MSEDTNKRALRKYTKMAYESELRKQLLKLHALFNEFETEHTDVWRLKEELESFSNKVIKGLDTTYVVADPAYAVAYAVRTGVLKLSDIPIALHNHIIPLLNSTKM